MEEAADRAKLTATPFASTLKTNRPTLIKSTHFALHNPTSGALQVRLPQQSMWVKRPYITATIAAAAIGLTSFTAYKYLTPTTTPSIAPPSFTFHSIFSTAPKVSFYALCIPTLSIAAFRPQLHCRKPASFQPPNPVAPPKKTLMMKSWHLFEDLAFGLKKTPHIYFIIFKLASKYCYNFFTKKVFNTFKSKTE